MLATAGLHSSHPELSRSLPASPITSASVVSRFTMTMLNRSARDRSKCGNR